MEIVEVAVEDLDVGAEEAVLADPDPGALGLDHQVVVELGAVADLDPRLRHRRLHVAVAGVEERRGLPAELDAVAEHDLAGADEEDRLIDDGLALDQYRSGIGSSVAR